MRRKLRAVTGQGSTRQSFSASLWIPLVGALLYVLLPGHPLAWFRGVPLGPLGLAVLVLLAVLLFAVWPPDTSRLSRKATLVALGLAVLAVAKATIGWVSPAYGLTASYYTRPGSSAPAERSTEFPHLPATRLDTELSFADDTFPLYFFNDNIRFNYYREDEPNRASLPFSVRWSGYVESPAAGTVTFWLTAIGQAQLEVSGAPHIGVDSADQAGTAAGSLWLPGGSIPIQVEYVRHPGRPATLTVEWDGTGARQTLAAPDLVSEQPTLPLGLAGPLLWTGRGLDVAFLLGLAALAALLVMSRAARWSPERTLLALLLCLTFAYASLSSPDLHRRAFIFDGGSDWLTYETYSRDILENGPLMTLGKSLGKGKPFYFQPFYPYVLAAAHWLTGEDTYGVVVLQLFGLGVAGVLVYTLAKRLFGWPSGLAALVTVLGVLGPLHLNWVARHLLSENIYFWLLPAAALSIARLGERPRAASALRSGILLGLCCITRAPTLLWAPVALFCAYLHSRCSSASEPGHVRPSCLRTFRVHPAGYFALCAAMCTAVVLLVPLRNLFVSGQPSLVATNGMATMELAHPLTSAVNLEDVEQSAIYRLFRLDLSVIRFIEFIRQDPAGYAATLVPLGLYSLGLPGLLEPGAPVQWELVTLVGLYLLSLLDPAARRLATWPLHMFIGMHLLVMMVFLPNVYGYRQVLPMYLFIAIFAGHVLARLLHWLSHLTSRSPQLSGAECAECHSVYQHVQRAGFTAGHEELA